MDITVLDALIISLIGFAIVFVVLFILMGIVMLMGLASDKGHVITDKLPKFKNPSARRRAKKFLPKRKSLPPSRHPLPSAPAES